MAQRYQLNNRHDGAEHNEARAEYTLRPDEPQQLGPASEMKGSTMRNANQAQTQNLLQKLCSRHAVMCVVAHRD